MYRQFVKKIFLAYHASFPPKYFAFWWQTQFLARKNKFQINQLEANIITLLNKTVKDVNISLIPGSWLQTSKLLGSDWNLFSLSTISGNHVEGLKNWHRLETHTATVQVKEKRHISDYI